jgi:hypothetical protein
MKERRDTPARGEDGPDEMEARSASGSAAGSLTGASRVSMSTLFMALSWLLTRQHGGDIWNLRAEGKPGLQP